MKKLFIRLRFRFSLVIAAVLSVFFLQVVWSQISGVDEKAFDKPVTIEAKGRGFPRVNFENGKDLEEQNPENGSGISQKLLTSADFDSDGTADLITVDSGGGVRFYRGNVFSIFPNNADQKKGDVLRQDAFFSARSVNSLPISPDFLESGDFNADGFSDILFAAKGGDRLYLLTGDGAGGFSGRSEIELAGAILSLTAGEIGTTDGQTDVAVAINNDNGSFLTVFEHPAGAFAHKAEIIPIPAETNDLAIGHLDNDYFGDIAIAGGSRITIVRGRGQTYPWDLMPEYDIKRPTPIVETRLMQHSVAAIAVGNFTDKRGQSLAILTTDGAIQTLESAQPANLGKNLKFDDLKSEKPRTPFKTNGKSFSKFASLKEYGEITSDLESTEGLFKMENGVPVSVNETKTKSPELSDEQKAEISAGRVNLDPAVKEKTKNNFLRAISPVGAESLSDWNLATIISDNRLANTAYSGSVSKFIKVRVSDSGRDELALVDSASKQIHFLIRENARSKSGSLSNEIVSLDVNSTPNAILPMRLNMDALSDLVVLREGANSPSVVMTSPAFTYTVTTSDDEGGDCDVSCSLREAIEAANLSPGPDTINFDISGATNIILITALPDIVSTMTIDGTSQPGYAGQPLIEIQGFDAGEGANGLSINATGVVVRGLAINEFKSSEDPDTGGLTGGNGIAIYNFQGETFSGFCVIEGNYLGTDTSGTIDRGNDQAGLDIFDSDSNTIGGSTVFGRNVISGNGNGEQDDGDRFGYGIAVYNGRQNLIIGNYVGVSSFGTQRLSNSSGIVLSGANNLVGLDAFGTGNVVSGNTHSFPSQFDPEGCGGNGISDVSLINMDTGEWVTANNSYKGNRLGISSLGNAAISNCRLGFETSPRNTAIVGSIAQVGRNTVSGNTDGGLYCSTVARSMPSPFLTQPPNIGIPVPEGVCTITGNNVGTDVSGTFAIPNDHSRGFQVFLFDGALAVYNTNTFSTIGGDPGTSPESCTGHCNLVSGNGDIGGITRVSPDGEVGIWKNFAGTNKNGTAAVPNGGGIGANGGNTRIGGVLTGGSGGEISLGNLASGNNGSGILAGPSLTPTLHIIQVQGNLVGTDVTGTTAIPNGGGSSPAFATVFQDQGVIILGGTHPLARNIISGNFGSGVVFLSGVLTTPIVNNYIGVNINGDPLGNELDGIRLQGGSFEYFGDNGVGNIIANNGRNGVYIFGFSTLVPVGNRLRFNSIYNNGALGIDLTADTTNPIEPDGVTPNDCLDADGLANGLQNYPILTAPNFNGDGTLTVAGGFESMPNATYTLDFYSNSTADPSDYGEGETYIGSKTIETDSNGLTAFEYTSTVQVPSNLKITATATDSNGSTSEFSCYAGQCSALTVNATKEEIIESLAPVCVVPIIVNINTDQPDTNPADQICDVDIATSGSQCSLRAAIETANAKSGVDYISFDISGGGVQTIAATSELPEISGQTILDATTQPGYVGTPLIELQGSAIPTASTGLQLGANSGNSSVKGFAINRFLVGIRLLSGSNRVELSYLGLSPNGNAAGTPTDQQIGIHLSGSGSTNNRIGGIGGIGNIISNSVTGILTSVSANTNKIVGNKIGTNPTSTLQIPNDVGITIQASNGNIIGGDTESEANTIVSNAQEGIQISDNSIGNTILRNYLGILPFVALHLGDSQMSGNLGSGFGNGGSGLLISNGSSNNLIGGANPASGPVIADNGGNGIIFSSTAGTGNRIQNASIFSNALLGIDIGGNGFTPNDPGDADTGPNNLQNYPEIMSKQIVNDELILGFRVDSDPANSAYGTNGIYVEFFKADSGGEGEKFIGSANYTLADYNSLVPGVKTVNLGNITTLGITASDKITVTATDADGNTSEFAPPLAPTAANVSIGGRIFSSANRGLPNAVVVLINQSGTTRTVRSNSFGYYKFDDIEAGQNVVLEVKNKQYEFQSRLISVENDVTNFDFLPLIR